MSDNKNKIQLPHFLHLTGSGQNVGKTMFACQIIQSFSREHNIVGIKVTPHEHKSIGEAMPIAQGEGFTIYEEINPKGNKDTSRMMAAGAYRALLVQSDDEHLQSALAFLLTHMDRGALVVCESGHLKGLAEPGLSLFFRQLNCKIEDIEGDKRAKSADRVVTYTNNGFDMSTNEVEIVNNTWQLK